MNQSSNAKSERMSPLSTDSWNYEQTVAKVERILTRIESGELELADVFEEFSAAVDYLRQCESFLAERQKQVDLLIETLTDEAEF
ncbi:exodeoxyribonuclease VII small subunit [Pseudanabaenaceae cyanobacterium LEGE 13415]|nr:exodeoxyribonuclease VII small subunit [Pseudanabaenaceae cyanobacterium LEGE 13415]